MAKHFHKKGKKQKSKNNFKKGKKEFKPTGKRGRLIVRNLPFKCNENELHKLFKPFGEVKDVQLLRRPDNKLVGCGFVEFTSRLNADRAVEKLNGSLFLGRPIYVERAVARERYDEPPSREKETLDDDGEEEDVGVDSEVKDEPLSDDGECFLEQQKVKQEDLTQGEEEEDIEDLPQKKKEQLANGTKDNKNAKNVKKARLIVRNLSFETTVDKVIEHFSPYGEVMEVKLLRRPNNTLVGCGFVQFAKKQSAAKAIYHTSGKPFLGRPIIVDWAVPKDTFKKIQEESVNKEIKKEDGSDDENKNVDSSNVTVKSEEPEDENQSEEESEQDVSGEEDDDEEEESDEEEDSDEEDVGSEVKQEPEETKQRRRVEDVDEGKTVFVKNLPFSADDDDFRECMEQFGPVFYALVCKDKLTERSKGSGFVKFKNKEDAEKCLSAGTELKLNDTILDPHPALKRSDAEKLRDKTKEKKDNRNLYLVKEGLIIAGTPAAKGVSVSDMEKRLQLEQWKTTKLRNLNMFVSSNRLVVHNLPATLNDKQLRKLFLKHVGSKAVIKEARVMRNMKHVDDKGHGLSKGYGFVSFEKHEDALTALRKINNNPTIFTPTARPIVAFSIENRAVLNMKMKRLERSKQKNPLCKEYKPDDEVEVPTKKAKYEPHKKNDDENVHQFVGMEAKRGGDMKMRKKHKLKSQAVQHSQDIRKQKWEMKMSRKARRAEHVKMKQVEKKTTKKNKLTKDKDVAFNSLVDKYKKKIMSQSKEKKKWYDE